MIFLDFSAWVLKNSAPVASLEVERFGPYRVASNAVNEPNRAAGRWHVRHRVTDSVEFPRPLFGRNPYRFFYQVDYSFLLLQFRVNLIRFTRQGLPNCFQLLHQMEPPGTVPWRPMPGHYRDESPRGSHHPLFFERNLEVILI